MIDLMIILQKMFIYIIQTPVHHGYLHLKWKVKKVIHFKFIKMSSINLVVNVLLSSMIDLVEIASLWVSRHTLLVGTFSFFL